MRVALLAIAAVAMAGPSAAQSVDTQLTYQNGVVYDDDLVPGRQINQPFLLEEQIGSGVGGVYDPYFGGRPTPQNSANLIGPDGRAVRGGR